ncbi:hypothetical protein VCRA2114E365_130119 [Vibrio crassostreae]|nr:conserved hypothetical protein [Vibrio chagasii]CAK1731722.1 hypothetical protein VCRA2115O371_120028 [Vibrio crassostreae]CAK1745283.1 hypothetical protein VCRA2114O367_130029 [Vibrio crassostreae]CAK1745875.1 hypothetical protein VCRA2113O354_130028 [Vibrio crassostreae]CAK1746849.1 hypothetical protein VCRA2117O376_130028 [Vibrio crassostreae]
MSNEIRLKARMTKKELSELGELALVKLREKVNAGDMDAIKTVLPYSAAKIKPIVKPRSLEAQLMSTQIALNKAKIREMEEIEKRIFALEEAIRNGD